MKLARERAKKIKEDNERTDRNEKEQALNATMDPKLAKIFSDVYKSN